MSKLSQLERMMYSSIPASSDSVFIRRWFETIASDNGEWFTYVDFGTKPGRVLDITALRGFALFIEGDAPTDYELVTDYGLMDYYRWRICINASTTMDYGETAAAANLPKPPGEFIVLNRNVLGEADDGRTHLIIPENSRITLEGKLDPVTPAYSIKVGFHMLGRWIPQNVYNRYLADMRGVK